MARVGKMCAYRVLIGKFEGMRSLGRSRRRREDNVMKRILKKEESVDWLKLNQDRDGWSAVVNAITNTGVP
jgi:hypothetical protein